jgi:hypothetical protein
MNTQFNLLADKELSDAELEKVTAGKLDRFVTIKIEGESTDRPHTKPVEI